MAIPAQLRSQNLQRGKGEGGAEYEMNVHYVPRAGAAIETGSNRPVDTTTSNGKTR